MLRTTKALGQLAEDLPTWREELQLLGEDARDTFSRVKIASTVAVIAFGAVAIVAVFALLVATARVVDRR